MLSIVDAFDSMTTDHVYRPARSRERAMAELFQCAGSQFDPELVRQVQELFAQDQNLLTEKLARRWLHRLPKDGSTLPWNVVEYERRAAPTEPTPSLFEKKLIDNMHDGVLFVDASRTHRAVEHRRRAAHRRQQRRPPAAGRSCPACWTCATTANSALPNEDCPVARAIPPACSRSAA